MLVLSIVIAGAVALLSLGEHLSDLLRALAVLVAFCSGVGAVIGPAVPVHPGCDCNGYPHRAYHPDTDGYSDVATAYQWVSAKQLSSNADTFIESASVLILK